MNALIEQCRRLGVRLRVEGGALAYDAPKGALTSELVAALRAHKAEIMALLAAPAALNLPGVSPDFAARLSSEDLNDIAAGDISIETVQAFEQEAIAREPVPEHLERKGRGTAHRASGRGVGGHTARPDRA